MDKYIESVDRCLEWIESQMLSFNRGSVGVYERIRIDVNRRVNWTRPDCNSEIARGYMKRGTADYDVCRNIVDWLLSTQDNEPLSCWYGSFPFFLNDGEIIAPNGQARWQNDNGKVLIALLDMYEITKDEKFKTAALKLASYWMKIQRDEGWFIQYDRGITQSPYRGPCFVFWMAAGIAMCYGVTGERKYLDSAKKALSYALTLQTESGRFKTSYELMKCEDWRPASSEASIAMFCLARILKYIPDPEYKAAFDKVCGYVLSIQHECGGVLNSDEEGFSASLQDDRMRCDLVYTEGFALEGFVESYKLTGEERFKAAAVKLADFLVSIQCKNESPLWDGAWRGAYSVVRKCWEGRANQNNGIDEGGMYSVYTGWCCSNIMDGLLGVSRMLNE
ncbi:MAG: hypothetical protein J5547_04425 [Clostridia bacterium]|nr:hypothetical protein [Clostridia bacterium]